MGLHRKNIKYFEEITEFLGYETFQGLRLCQLGDIYIRKDARRYLWELKDLRYTHQGPASNYYRDLGFEVVTIDLGVGSEPVYNDVLKYDLCKPIGDIGKFDFIIELGTGEHIKDQFEFFRNIHNLCKVDGIIIRCNPSIRWGRRHGIYYYTFAFYQKFVQTYNYQIIDIREGPGKYITRMSMPWKHCLFVTLRKTQDSAFLQSEWAPVGEELGTYDRQNRNELVALKTFR